MRNFTATMLSFCECIIFHSRQYKTVTKSGFETYFNIRANIFERISARNFLRRFHTVFVVFLATLMLFGTNNSYGQCPDLGIAPPSSVLGDTVCSGGSSEQVSMSAVCASGTTPIWYASTSSTLALATGAEYSPIVSTTTTFYVSCKDTIKGCETLPANRRSVVGALIKEVDNGGTIAASQEGCGTFDPVAFTNVTPATGSSTTVEYLWLKSTTATTYTTDNQLTDWFLIAGATAPAFNAGPISKTTAYIRCSRSAGCVDYSGESNIVIVTIKPIPMVSITPISICKGATGTLTAITTANTYLWSSSNVGFTNDTTKSISVSQAGTYSVAVTANGCTATATTTVIVDNQPSGLTTTAINATCESNVSKNDGQVKLMGEFTGLKYDIVEGATYTGTKTKYIDAIEIPANGVLKSNIANPATAMGTKYTVRVFNTNNCYVDYTATIQQVACLCGEAKCVPFGGIKTVSGKG